MNNSFTQQALAADRTFLLRVQNLLADRAWFVLTETPAPPNYAARAAYARLVLADLPTYAAAIARSLVTRTNLMAFATSYDFVSGAIVTASGDADIQSQLTTDWDHLSGA